MNLNLKKTAQVAVVALPCVLGAAGSVGGWGISIDNRLTATETDIKTIKAVDEQREKRTDQGISDIRDTVHEILRRMDRRAP